jgi:AraC-like DNA-binding protein
MHPNYLNALLKKQTGQNVSAYIRNRLLEEAKTLLLQTNWNLQHIAYSIGSLEQSNFNFFFQKEYRVHTCRVPQRLQLTLLYRYNKIACAQP